MEIILHSLHQQLNMIKILNKTRPEHQLAILEIYIVSGFHLLR